MISFGAWWRATGRLRVVTTVLIVSVLLWEFLVSALEVPAFIVPAPSRIFDELARAPLWLATHTYYTLSATLIGFALAVLIGVVLAALIVSSRLVEQTLYTLLVALNSIPKVAVAPLFIIWVGTGIEAKIAMAAVIALFAIVVDMVLGLRSADPDMVDLARSLGGKRLSIMMKIQFPNALPSLFAGMKVAITLALIGAIVGEFVASSHGLGYVIMTAQSSFDTTRIFAALVILAVVGTLLFIILDWLERLVLPWHVSRRREELVQA